MKQNSNVPAFLSKLWTLVEDSDTNEFITWSQNGQSFLVLDEQRFAKEILPKYFKHNNMASFVRQLNMYGFRKVVHVDSGIVKQERDGPVEFQHPFFMQGQDELLENIKRKVSSVRPEEAKVRQEDISKILNNAAKVQAKQDTIDTRLFTLKRENEALWREVSDLRAKHSQQQQVIRKIVQFIVTLVQNNRLVSLKRKQPLLLNTKSSPKGTLLQTMVKETGGDSRHVPLRTEPLKRGEISDDIVIYDITDNIEDVGVKTHVSPENPDNTSAERLKCLFFSIVLQLETKGMESFRNVETFPESTEDSRKSDQQLVQYTTYPLMAFLDGDPGNLISETQTSKTNEADNLLESSLDSQPTQSKLVRLEPLTEAEANEATLFYLCELAPTPLDSDMPLLDN
ncbi:hypothetical protein GDO78_001367 [Eleutherodactylus coqui]|uniref:HSF-type DNA-binding domain-containing protein n=1 Tax=Eleutherodactylus coqui TaxID=57060 RepID=A0A8J6KNF1_ELECQ|nr:hypothetical protein GDO78_001367 [Eleutherodactylus coqui]